MKLFEPSLVPTCVGFLFKILLAILVTASCGHVLHDGDASSLVYYYFWPRISLTISKVALH